VASLVYHAGALGDFLTALPALHAWRILHPAQHIVLLGLPGFAALAGTPIPFDEVWDASSARFAALFGECGPADARLLAPFASFGSALLFALDSSPLRRNLAAAGVRGIIRQDPFPAEPVPIVDYHLALFPTLAFSDQDRIPRVAHHGRVFTGSAPVALAPGSGSAAKCWPLERYLGLARALEIAGAAVTWIRGPAEQGLVLPPGATVLNYPLLPDLASFLAGCRLYVGNDSGVTHLAAACGCSVVALFGASDPRVWSPRGRQVRVITGLTRHMHAIEVAEVLEVCWGFLKQ
jgi:ADP-heptose:LPS heptosyltransferase